MPLSNVKVLLQDFVSLLYPEVCIHCDDILVKNENFLCTNCQSDFPFTNFHHQKENPLFTSFAFLNKIDFATSYLKFQQSGVAQSILHQIKYNGNYELGVEMGKLFGRQINAYLRNYDFMIPVPLHPKKIKIRGYNQSMAITEGVSRVTGIAIREDIAFRTARSISQTTKSRLARWSTMQKAYVLKNENDLYGKSVIIVDDVITTGATMGQLAEMIENQGVAKIAIISLATGKK